MKSANVIFSSALGAFLFLFIDCGSSSFKLCSRFRITSNGLRAGGDAGTFRSRDVGWASVIDYWLFIPRVVVLANVFLVLGLAGTYSPKIRYWSSSIITDYGTS